MKKIGTVCAAATLAVMTIVPAYADAISDSQLGQGVSSLMSDVFTFLVVLCPSAGAAAAAYFAIRRSMADEQDGKLWEKRIKTAIACGVGGCLVSLAIKLVTSYFVG